MGRLSREELDAVLGKILTGTKFQVTFARDAIDDLMYLRGMVDQIVRMPKMALVVLMAIQESGRWGKDNNCTFELEAMEGFDPAWFRGRLDSRLDSIKIVSQPKNSKEENA